MAIVHCKSFPDLCRVGSNIGVIRHEVDIWRQVGARSKQCVRLVRRNTKTWRWSDPAARHV